MNDTPKPAALRYGYDLSRPEPIQATPPPVVVDVLPPGAIVAIEYMPPVQDQYLTPNCAAWASTYGVGTFTAAQAGGYIPSKPSQQASSAYIYVGVMEEDGWSDWCAGSLLSDYFTILQGGGTPSMEQAPFVADCGTLWNEYSSQDLAADATFTIPGFAAVGTTIDDIKQILVSGKPLAYGTSLYTDFPDYAGSPVPYVGNGTIMMEGGEPVGHCMVILGYDDAVGEGGAFLIQNSFGTGWGGNGFVWMAYDTFTALTQSQAFYVTD